MSGTTLVAIANNDIGIATNWPVDLERIRADAQTPREGSRMPK
jgi:hypothetical protein